MRVAVADGLELAVSVRGAGPPVLLIHGFGGAAGAWGEAVLAGLSGYRVLAIDLIGHGASDNPAGPGRVSLDRVLDDLEAVLDAEGVRACPWIGYSMGGRIALAAAALCADRVRALVLESASPGIEDERERAARREEDEILAASIEREGVEAWAQEWERRPLFGGRAALPEPARSRFLAQRLANRAGSLAAWLRGAGAGAQPSFWARLPEIGVPTLVVTGARDERFSQIGRRMAAALPSAEHRTIEGAGHTLHLEVPAVWADAVTSFLARIPAE